jgi:uncharacterized protein (TIGR02145 family)
METKTNRLRWIVWATILISLAPGCTEDPLYPLASFDIQGDRIRKDYKFILDASASVSRNPLNDQLLYRWDTNGDHAGWETDWLSSPTIAVVLPGVSWSCFIGLQIKDFNENITEVYQYVPGLSSSFNKPYKVNHIGDSISTIINYSDHAEVWMVDNLYVKPQDGVSALPENLYRSYLSWEKALPLNYNSMVLPSLTVWQKMIEFCGGSEVAGYNMPLDVEHGLKLQYGGFGQNGSFSETGQSGYYWTSTEVDASSAYAIKITKGSDRLEIVQLPKNYQLSVRLYTPIPHN